jgi:glycosyltransferase involved in cell wall biosynthesis
MTRPKISLITAVYNNASTLEATLTSIVSQKYENLEYIIVDGGSTDGSQDILKKYSRLVTTLISEKDSGIYDALNKGIKASTGDIVGFLNADDHFASDTVLKTIAEAFEDPGVSGLYSDLDYISSSGTVIRHWQSRAFNEHMLLEGWMPPHPTLYLRKSIYDQVGLFDLQYKIASDYDMVLRVFTLPNAHFHYLPMVTVKMRVGGASNRNIQRILRKSTEDFLIATRAGLPAFSTILQKNFRKVGQFFLRGNR